MYIINQNNEKIINTDNVRSIWPDGCRILFSSSMSTQPKEETLAFFNEGNALEAYHEIEDALFERCRVIKISEAFISPEDNASCANDNAPQLFVDRAE